MHMQKKMPERVQSKWRPAAGENSVHGRGQAGRAEQQRQQAVQSEAGAGRAQLPVEELSCQPVLHDHTLRANPGEVGEALWERRSVASSTLPGNSGSSAYHRKLEEARVSGADFRGSRIASPVGVM